MTNEFDRVPGPDHKAEVSLSSKEPGVELGPAKAVTAAIVGGVTAAGASLLTALSDGVIDLGEIYAIIGAGLVGAGLITGGSTFAKATKVTIK